MPTTVVKLGSALVADDQGVVRDDVLAAVSQELAQRSARDERFVIVSSGAIACGLRELGITSRPTAMEELQAASAVGQGIVYRAWHEHLGRWGVRSAQVLLTFFDMAQRAHYVNARHTLATLLRWGVVPVVNENDTTTTDEISFGDNDFLAAQVAILVEARLLVLLTDTAGLYTADPRRDPAARLVSEVRDPAELRALEVGGSGSELGSGGMRSKVAAAEMVTGAGIPCVVASGTDRRALATILDGGRAGTYFHARRGREQSFKLWLRYAKPTRGELLVDAGAARALTERGSSLLPVGIVEVRGEFEPGDAVEIRHDGRVIGKGIVNYGSAELRRVRGLTSDRVRQLLPHASEEAVHRDYLVVLAP